MKKLLVVAGIIKYQELFLCVQRGLGKYEYISNKFEFPGGKVEAGESFEAALVREIKEELDMHIIVESPLIIVEHTYPDFAITMHGYNCITSSNQIVLKEHIASQWLKRLDLPNLDWAAADIPIVTRLVAGL